MKSAIIGCSLNLYLLPESRKRVASLPRRSKATFATYTPNKLVVCCCWFVSTYLEIPLFRHATQQNKTRSLCNDDMASGQDPRWFSTFHQCEKPCASNIQALACLLRTCMSIRAPISSGLRSIDGKKANGDDLHIVDDIVQQVSPSLFYVYSIVSPQTNRNRIYT